MFIVTSIWKIDLLMSFLTLSDIDLISAEDFGNGLVSTSCCESLIKNSNNDSVFK